MAAQRASEARQRGPDRGGADDGSFFCPRFLSWDEIASHTGRGDSSGERWLVIERKVYDISGFHKRHPGGSRVISHYAGQDATDPFIAFHPDRILVRKYMKSLLIGELAPDQPSFEPSKNKLVIEDFRVLRSTAEKMGLFKSSKLYFSLLLLHIIMLDAAGCFVLWYFGMSLTTFFIATVLLTLAQSQGKWLQHDLGHRSVFSNPRWNHVLQQFVMCHLKGLSANWWTLQHSQHHAKPNCYRKDPDLDFHPRMFSFGKILSVELGQQRKKYMPYNHQHKYFFITMPLIVMPVFQIFSLYFMVKRKLWGEMAWSMAYFVRFFATFVPIMGLKGTMGYILLLNVLESIIFTWISQMSHIPMHIDYDRNMDWFSTQLLSTCNVKQSFVNDWITGHLNFQIEHHLFPTMPRHNFWKVAPLVKAVCAKHGIDYQTKPLLTAFADVVRSLKDAGQIWLKAYNHG